MPKNRKNTGRRERRLRVREDLRREPDLRKIANTVIALAMAQTENDAQAQQGRDPTRLEQEEPGQGGNHV